jgi:hypothetical protein
MNATSLSVCKYMKQTKNFYFVKQDGTNDVLYIYLKNIANEYEVPPLILINLCHW